MIIYGSINIEFIVGDSVDDPIGAVQLTLIYTVETVVSKNRQTKAWWVKGNGEIDEL